MKVDLNSKLNFKRLYVAGDIKGLQIASAYSVAQKLSRKGLDGVKYIDAIKNLGYDVLVIRTELNDPEIVRLCIIKDMESMKQPDGTYDYFDAKIICETDKHFSAESFLNTIKNKTSKDFGLISKCKKFITDIFK